MSHSDFLQSLKTNDGRRWRIEEMQGEAIYTDITQEKENPYTSKNPGPAIVRRRKLMTRYLNGTSPDRKAFSWRLGYNICTGQYTGGQDVPMLSGSSVNRKPGKKYPAKKSEENAVHVMSKRTKGKIRDKAKAFFRAIPERIFVTMTFIEHVDDKEGRRILNKFLTMVRRETRAFEYLNVSEHHPERETHTIHFHTLSSKRLNVQRYNALWVLQQYNAGLIGHRENGEEIPMSEITDRYNNGTIGDVLNPVQIEKAYSISGLSWYLTKYVTKQETGEKFGCLTWHCSRKVSRLFTSQLVGPSAFAFLRSFRNYKVDRKTGECWKPQEIKGNFFVLVFVNNGPAVLENLKMLEMVNRWIIEKFKPDPVYAKTCNFKNTWEQYKRIFIGKDMQWDPAGVVEGILSQKKFLSSNKIRQHETKCGSRRKSGNEIITIFTTPET